VFDRIFKPSSNIVKTIKNYENMSDNKIGRKIVQKQTYVENLSSIGAIAAEK
jgi:hypothetical protein